MNHTDAVQLMAVERYLLDELTPTLRDEFEEHMFDCAECSLDLRAESAFLHEAKIQLPQLVSAPATSQRPVVKNEPKRDWFASTFGWLRPVFAVPAFAAMLAVIGYQNIQTIPSLRASAASPRLTPWVSYHTGTRGAAHLDLPADRKQGAGVAIQLSQETPYATYIFDLYDPQGGRFWTHSISGSSLPASGTYALSIPGIGLEQGSYTLVITGLTAQGDRTEVDRHILDVHFDQ
jgi:anti-sigma factor RsiW